MLDAYAIVQAQTALQLNDEQYGQFVTRLKRLQETRRRQQAGPQPAAAAAAPARRAWRRRRTMRRSAID